MQAQPRLALFVDDMRLVNVLLLSREISRSTQASRSSGTCGSTSVRSSSNLSVVIVFNVIDTQCYKIGLR